MASPRGSTGPVSNVNGLREPAGESGLRGSKQVRPRVEEGRARPAAQPLETAAGEEVHAEGGDVERNDAGRLIPVEQHERAAVVCARHDRGRVHDERRLEQHVGERDECRPLVNRGEQAVERHDEVRIGGDDGQLEAERLLGAIEIDERREIGGQTDNPVALRSRLHARQRHHRRRRHVLVHADGSGWCADDAAHLVADFTGHLPPALLPGAHAACRPRVRVLGQRLRRPARHRAERVADHVDGRCQDGELGAPALEIIGGHRASSVVQAFRLRFASTRSGISCRGYCLEAVPGPAKAGHYRRLLNRFDACLR